MKEEDLVGGSVATGPMERRGGDVKMVLTSAAYDAYQASTPSNPKP
jgi:hypothetical protein